MRKIFLPLALLLTLLARVSAQVTMELVLDQEQFIRSESVPLRVRITNTSGQTLHLGKDPNWLSFTVDGENGVSLPRLAQVPVTRPFDLESSKTVTLQTDLMLYFNLAEVGHYTVAAKANLSQINLEVGVKPKTFDITTGTKIWERDFGVPHTTPPDARKYALQQATFLKQMRIYARVTDVSESRVFRVQMLGSLVSFSKPEALVDSSSNLHVLFQDGQSSFSYCIVNPNGETIIRRTYDYTGTRPRLGASEGGIPSVTGGARRVTLNDLPPPVTSTNAINAPK